MSGFFGFIHNFADILYTELYAIYQGLLLAKDMGIIVLVCYFDSLRCINIINGPSMIFVCYTVLIQDIKKMIQQGNITVNHTLREENQCADVIAKFGASFNVELIRHDFPSMNLLHFL